MNRDTAEGNWTQLKGKIKQKWGKLTDNDLTRAEGDKDYLIGKLHEQYGLAKDKAEDELQTLGYRGSDESDSEPGFRKGHSGDAGRGGQMKAAGSGGDRPESVDENVEAEGYADAEGNRSSQLNAGGSQEQGNRMDAAGAGDKDAQRRGEQGQSGSNQNAGRSGGSQANDKSGQQRGGQNSPSGKGSR